MSRNCANPLYRDWVKEWMDQAQAIQSKAYYTYKKAYDSLDKCTEEFAHPSQTIVLAGIGPGLTQKLEERMTRYCKDNGLPVPQRPKKGRKRGNQGTDDEEEDTTRPVRKARPYVPQYRTGGYGILLCLLEFYVMGRENISKEQICRVAQDFCNSSYTLADAGKSYTAWSSMKTLMEKGYVYKCGSPAKFSLTETGADIAKRLKASSASATSSNSQAGPSTPTIRPDTEVVESFNRNPSTARSSSKRKNARGSTTNDALDNILDSYATNSNEVDMSLYVLNPTEHQSISINGRTSNTNNNNGEGSASSRMFDEPDILHALAESSRPKKKQKGKRKTKTTTASLLDNLLNEMGDQNSGPDMSQYVLNPSEHQSITVGNRTTHKNSTATSTPNSSSSLNTSNSRKPSSVNKTRRSSFARDLMDNPENHSFDSMDETFSLPSSSYSSNSRVNNSGKYRTPATSTILQKFNNSNENSKLSYTIDDDDDIDLIPSSLPTFQSSQVDIQSNDIVDLLSSPELSPITRPTTRTDDSSFHADFDLESDYFPVSQALTDQIMDETFHYTYLDDKNEDVRSVAKAYSTYDTESDCAVYRIRFYTSQRYHPKCKKLIKVSTDDTHIDCSIGYIKELDADSICPGLPARPLIPLHREEPDDFWPRKPTGVRRDKVDESSQRSINSQVSSQSSFFSQSILSQSSFSQQSSQQSSQLQSQTQTQTQENNVDYDQLIKSLKLERMLPGEYEIVLVLDNREIQMKTSRDYFQRKLGEKGIQCITRALDLGDVIWVARKKGNTNEEQELFLDYIVERKRLDDLVSSIKDGRYVEQKKRLRISGAEKVIYLVEDYNRDDAVNFGLQAIQTAMSSLQIIEGFYLRRTDNIDETVEFLVSATKLMESLYKDTTLYSIPGEIITRQNYLDLKKAFRAKSVQHKTIEKSAYLIKYPLYAELNTKNGATTVGELFLRMLMTIRGVNAERAMTLTKIYPTPHALLKAFQGKTADEGKKLAREATKHHINRRRWGVSVSEQLYNVWGADSYPPSVDDEFD